MNVIEKCHQTDSETRVAHFSPCEKYRYKLAIIWDSSLPACQFIGLNPSTATELVDDPTIRRCKDFAKSWNFGGLMMTNIFAYRATLPKDMRAQIDPVGIENDRYLLSVAKFAGRVVAAWGAHGEFKGRSKEVRKLFRDAGISLQCFKLTASGEPYHPLYMAKVQPLQFLES